MPNFLGTLSLGFSLLIFAGSALTQPAHFSFGAFGDTPYGHSEIDAMRALVASMGKVAKPRPLTFTIHVGDFKSGAEPCSDELFTARHADFMESAVPLIFVPGDNEWTDCHRPSAGRYSPTERLRKLRQIFFATGQSLGRRKIALTQQPVYTENLRWTQGAVQFVTLNLPGSNNNWLNVQQRTALRGRDNREFLARELANAQWLKAAFAHARQERSAALVLAFQANPDFENDWARAQKPREGSGLRFNNDSRDGYASFKTLLAAEAAAFGKPVLVIHGDTHQFRDDRPVQDAQGKPLANVRRVEVYGSPFLGWVRVDVDPAAADPFTVTGSRW